MFQIKKKTQKNKQTRWYKKYILQKFDHSFVIFIFIPFFKKKKKSFKYKTKEKKCILIFVDGCCWSVMAFPKW